MRSRWGLVADASPSSASLLPNPKFDSLEALYVPNLALNLLLMASLDSQGADIHFGSGKVTITNSSTCNVLAHGHRESSLFRLTTLLSRSSISPTLKHARFGHLCLQQLQQAACDSFVEGLKHVTYLLRVYLTYALSKAYVSLAKWASNNGYLSHNKPLHALLRH